MSFTIVPHAQRSPAWFAARCGRLTGSGARAMRATVPYGEALTRRAYRRQLVYERYTGVPHLDGFVSAVMRRGFEQEPGAIRAYEAETGTRVTRSGFLAHTTLEAGCSLDGHVDDFAGILEVKAPNSSTQVRYLMDGRLPAPYLAQVTHNLWISSARWCDFVSFDDRCGPRWRLFVVRVQAADVDLAGYAAAAVAFLAEVDAELRQITAFLQAPAAGRGRERSHVVSRQVLRRWPCSVPTDQRRSADVCSAVPSVREER